MDNATTLTIFVLFILLLIIPACTGDDDDDDIDDLSDDDISDDDDDDAMDDDTLDDDDDDDVSDDDISDDDDDDDFADDDDDDDDDIADDDDDDAALCLHNEQGTSEWGEVHIEDIPVGLAVYITFGGYDILVNGGADDDLDLVINSLLDHGVRALEEIIIASVADEDIGELEDILDQFGADIIRKGPAVSNSPVYTSLMSKINTMNIPVQVLSAGDTITDWNGSPEVVLSPPFNIPASFTDQDKSLVIKMDIGNTDIILADSVGFAAEQWMIGQWPGELCGEILVVGDHGSALATSPEWLDEVQPVHALISAAFRNPWGYPDPGTVALLESSGATVWTTMSDGHMKLTSNGFFYDVVCGT